MIFTFDIESSYNTPNYGRSYTIDVENERIQKNMNYEVQTEALRGRATKRNSTFTTVGGRVIAELTMQNSAWSHLTGCLLGQRIAVSGFKFSENAKRPWGMLISYLNSNITADSTATIDLNEDVTGDFDGVDGIIINDEIIKGDSTNGTFNILERGAEGTTARAHSEKDLVYGISEDVDRSIVITSRKKVGGFFEQTISLSAVVDRGEYHFGYSGLVIDSMTFNMRVYDDINTNIEFLGADSTSNLGVLDATIYDTNKIVDLTDVKVCSEHASEQFRQFFIEYNNSLRTVHGYDGKPQKHFLTRAATFGTLTWTEESINHVLQYEANTKRHYNISLSEGNYRMIFPFNDVRINTNSYYMDGELLIQDSAPWYSFEDAIIMYQF
jgi:hypothetical protein